MRKRFKYLLVMFLVIVIAATIASFVFSAAFYNMPVADDIDTEGYCVQTIGQ